jgi:hypothetical protein
LGHKNAIFMREENNGLLFHVFGPGLFVWGVFVQAAEVFSPGDQREE